MTTAWKLVLALLVAAALALGACGDDDDADEAIDRTEEAAEDVQEAAEDAWASFRTDFERLVDEASTGDDDARDELLDRCRDTLEDLRQEDSPDAERVGEICDQIRDADDETAWDDIRREIDEIDAAR